VSADGRYIAAGWGSDRHRAGMGTGEYPEGLHLYEVATGQQVWVRPIEAQDASVMTLTRDSRTLIVGTHHGTWDYHDLRPVDWKEPARWRDRDYDLAWQVLAERDAVKGYTAVWNLSSRGNEAVAWLRKQVKPGTIPRSRIKGYLADLDSNDFETRRTARQELAKLGEAAEAALREASKAPPSAEVKHALEQLLALLEKRSPERLRAGRLLTVLERIGTRQARTLLDELAKGAAGAYLTEEARRASGRVALRGGR
jgi:hypothetical protein